MSSFLQLASERCSVRQYSRRDIEPEKLQSVLEAARMAPSACNRQPWKLLLITPDTLPEIIRNIHRCYERDWFRTAPYYLIGVIEHDQSWHRPDDNKDHGDIDIAILAEHVCLAAADQGLGTCWVCNFNASLCHELFALGENEEAAVIIPLGYPSDDFKPASKIRKALTGIVVQL